MRFPREPKELFVLSVLLPNILLIFYETVHFFFYFKTHNLTFVKLSNFFLQHTIKSGSIRLAIDIGFHFLKMDIKQKLTEYIQSQHLRWTNQREEIVSTFIDSAQHLTTEELFSLVRAKNPEIGYATVSRTLHLLVEAGICSQIDISDGSMRYEITYGHEHHDHLVCTDCGQFIEIVSPEIERLQSEIVQKHGFLERHHKLQIFGKCPDCQKKQSGDWSAAAG